MRTRARAGADPGRRIRIGLFGRLGAHNLGNDASLEAILAFLARALPAAEVDCMCSGPDDVASRYGLPATHLHWLHAELGVRSRLARLCLTVPRIVVGAVVDAVRTASWVRRHDVVIVPGMGVLESTVPQRLWQVPYSLFLLSQSGRLFATKVAFVGVGASPTKERLTGRLLATAGRLAHYRSFRDQYSLDTARTAGMAGEHDRVYPDLAFALSTPAPGAESRTVGVGVMAYFGGSADRPRADAIHAAYVEQLTLFVRWLVDTGHQVRLVIGDAADEPVARKILAETLAPVRPADTPSVVFHPVASFAELMTQLSSLDAVVATRFHNVLGALACGRPTIAVGYGEKHRALMAQMGVGEFVHDIRSLDADLLKRQFTTLQTQRDQVERTLAAASRHNRAHLEEQFDELRTALFAAADQRARSSVR